MESSAAEPFPVPLFSGIVHERFQHGPLVVSRLVVSGPFPDGEQVRRVGAQRGVQPVLGQQVAARLG